MSDWFYIGTSLFLSVASVVLTIWRRWEMRKKADFVKKMDDWVLGPRGWDWTHMQPFIAVCARNGWRWQVDPWQKPPWVGTKWEATYDEIYGALR